MPAQHQIVIVGGGTAGITVAAQLLTAEPGLDVAIIEPSESHFYQPLWTLVGGGLYPREASRRDEALVIPRNATWIRDAAEQLDPAEQIVRLRNGASIKYDFLVVAPGLQINWDGIPGLAGAVGSNGVCSNYAYDFVAYTWETLRKFRGGTALFTQPSGAIKCGGAPQKVMYLAEQHFRRSGVRPQSRVVFASATPRIYAVERYARTLEQIVTERGIETLLNHELIELRPDAHQAVFRRIDSGDEVTLAYDMIHVTPPMGPPGIVSQSPLADAAGWVDLDRHTLRHPRFPNVFGLGDASNLPTSKTGAAIRAQAPVVVENLRAALHGRPLTASYNGYTSCPIVTGYDGLVLAEFDYDKELTESFPFDQSRPRFSMLMLKQVLLPSLYWHGMLRGRM